jgi:hypothetical protein
MPVYRCSAPSPARSYLLRDTGCWCASRRPCWRRAGSPTVCSPRWVSCSYSFGYVENYSFAAAGVLAYLWLGLAVLGWRQPALAGCAALALTNATHPSTDRAGAEPALSWLAHVVQGNRCKLALAETKPFVAIVLQMALPLALVGGATFVWMEAERTRGLCPAQHGSPWRRRCPLVRAAVRDDDALGALHPVELAPPARLAQRADAGGADRAAGVGGAGLGGWVLRWRADENHAGIEIGVGDWPLRQSPISISQSSADPIGFLAIASVCYLLFTFVWNPDYGGQRDWDLFSLAALPATLLLAASGRTGRWRSGAGCWALLPLIILQAGTLRHGSTRTRCRGSGRIDRSPIR